MPVKKNPTPRELEVEFCDLKLQPVEIMTNKNTEIISIEPKILTIRGVKVMLDSDLAALHGVITGRLNEAVKRNLMCFPEEFMFRLTKEEWQNLKSQIALSSWGGRRKLPLVFTEHGVTMLSSVLNSPRAVQINIQIIKAFIALRRYALAQKPENITRRIGLLEKALLQYMDRNDKRVNEIVETINDMPSADDDDDTKQIGFIKIM